MLWNKIQGAGGVGGTLTYDVLAGPPANNSFSVGYPSDIQAGDLLVVRGTVAGAVTPTVPGWDNTNAAPYYLFAYKTAVGSETGTVQISSGANVYAVMIRFRNNRNLPFSAGNPIETGEYASSSTVTLSPPTGVSPTYFANILGWAQPGSFTTTNYPAFSSPIVRTSYLFFTFVDTQFLKKEGDTVSVSTNSSVSWRSFSIYH